MSANEVCRYPIESKIKLKMTDIHPVEMADKLKNLVFALKSQHDTNKIDLECLRLSNSIVDRLDSMYRKKYEELNSWEEELIHREDAIETREEYVDSHTLDNEWLRIRRMEAHLKEKEDQLIQREAQFKSS